MSTLDTSDTYDTTEVGDLLGITREAVSWRIKMGYLKAYKLKNEWRIPKPQVDRIIAERQAERDAAFA